MQRLRLFLFVISSLLILACGGEEKTYVLIETPYGDMKAELYDQTPRHRDNFIKLANEGYFDGTLFHRVMYGFMIQGGDPDSKTATPDQVLGMGGPGYLIDAEIGAPHFKGTLAAARMGDASNPQKKSSGSQFFIVHGRKATDRELDAQERRFGFKYNDAQREKYKTVGGTPMLDMDYTVFGELITGQQVLDQIAQVRKDEHNRPLEDIKMKVRVIK